MCVCILLISAVLLISFPALDYYVQCRLLREDCGNYVDICSRYYTLEVSYFKSALDRKLLENLWNKYWVNTLSSSSLLTVCIVYPNVGIRYFVIVFSRIEMNKTLLFCNT
jgi:hypothetical protein